MKLLHLLPLLAVLISAAQAVEKPSAHTKGTPTGKPTGPLKPGEYWWRPQLSPSGPLIVLISVPEQVMNVYRNGILIGRSTVSTGSTGHATPGGVFSILEKKQEHFSKTYDNAGRQARRWMWVTSRGRRADAEKIASRLRMNPEFAGKVYDMIAPGTTVIITDQLVVRSRRNAAILES
jgi:L,D-transpeptidase catalytic domain